MDTEIKNAIRATEGQSEYDECAKRLLSQKIILAHILVKTVDEFKHSEPEDIVNMIIGKPVIGIIPVDSGMTNKENQKTDGQRIMGFNTESVEINEGLVRFDIIFYVRMKDGISQIIINVEAQKNEPTAYNIINRCIFYASRLISSQKERDFENMNFDDIKRVYSIWLCMNMSDNTLAHIHLIQDNIIGIHKWAGNIDLFNIIMIGLSKNLPEHDKTYELHRLLIALLSNRLNEQEKLKIINEEYSIPLEQEIRKDVNIMCNLGQGVFEQGEELGRELGKELGKELGRELVMKKHILKMHDKGYPNEEIAEIVEKDKEYIRKVIEESKLSMV